MRSALFRAAEAAQFGEVLKELRIAFPEGFRPGNADVRSARGGGNGCRHHDAVVAEALNLAPAEFSRASEPVNDEACGLLFVRHSEEREESRRAFQPVAFLDAKAPGVREARGARGRPRNDGKNGNKVRNLRGINLNAAESSGESAHYARRGFRLNYPGAEAREDFGDGPIALKRVAPDAGHFDGLSFVARERAGSEPEGGVRPVAFNDEFRSGMKLSAAGDR